jgi:hypothetical protein
MGDLVITCFYLKTMPLSYQKKIVILKVKIILISKLINRAKLN